MRFFQSGLSAIPDKYRIYKWLVQSFNGIISQINRHMKRMILLVIMMVFLFPYVGHAQLNITNKSEKIERISSARTGFISLNKQGDIYYVGLHSSNQFDNPGIFYLGKDKESSLATLNDLLTLQETLKKGEYVVTVAPKKTKLIECYINGGERAHKRVIVIDPEKYDEVMKDWGRKGYNSRYLDKLAGGVPLF
jgi:hypothetical protein